VKKLRLYKGFAFNPVERMWNCGGLRYGSAAEAIASPYHNLTDDDHAALMDLKANPYEPEPRLEDVVRRGLTGMAPRPMLDALTTRVAAELRDAYPHIDSHYERIFTLEER
jgi:hypothetical protein